LVEIGMASAIVGRRQRRVTGRVEVVRALDVARELRPLLKRHLLLLLHARIYVTALRGCDRNQRRQRANLRGAPHLRLLAQPMRRERLVGASASLRLRSGKSRCW
jgi:hypothetical protein